MKKLLLHPVFIALLFLSAFATDAFAADGLTPLKTKKAKYADGDNADLRNLYTSEGYVWPVVTKDVTETNLISFSYLEQLSLTPVLQDPNAHAVISYQSPDGGISVPHNTESAPFAIEKLVASKFYIKVTSANGLVKKTYIVNLPVLHTITNMQVGTGGSAPAFDPANFNYHIDVPPDRSSLEVTISPLQNTRWVLEGHKMSPITSSSSLIWTASQLDLGDNFYTLRTYPPNGPLTIDRVLETYHFTIWRSPPLTVSATHTDIAGENDPVNYTGRPGTATAAPNGGTAPYTYSWFNVSTNTALSQTTAAVDGLNGYKYKVTVTDFYGATNTTSVTIKQTVPFILILPTCPDLNNGIFEPGGLPGVGFNINGEGLYVSGTTPAKLTNIPSSWVYGVTVGTEYYELYPPTKQNLTIEVFIKNDVSTYGGSNGRIILNPKYASGNAALTTLAWFDLSTNTQIAVTEEDHRVTGLKAGTYRVISTAPDICPVSLDITITQPKSSNANLSNLAISSGTLSPVFAADALNYSATVSTAVNNITITPTFADTTATISYNGQTYKAGAAISVALVPGNTSIPLLVTAQAGNAKTYTLTVTRESVSPINLSLSYTISPVSTLIKVKGSANYNYTTSVAADINSITITPKQADVNAVVTVEGIVVARGAASAPIPLSSATTTVHMVITAPSGAAKTYAIAVSRNGSSNVKLSFTITPASTLTAV
ncbi:MAG: cadherin-like beta sandwich domain-containing protein, partial [Sphingobacteriaceae bacterium]